MNKLKFGTKSWRIITMYAGMWLLFLLLNTDNPVARFLYMPGEKFIYAGRPFDYFIYFFSAILFCLINFGLLWVGFGPNIKQLFRKFSVKWLLLAIGVIVIGLILSVAADWVMQYLPDNSLDLPSSLDDLQYEYWLAYLLVTIHSFFIVLGQQAVIIAAFIGMIIGIKKTKLNPQLGLVIVCILSLLVTGVISNSPDVGNLTATIFPYSLIELPYLYYFYKHQNILAAGLIAWIVQQSYVLLFILVVIL